MVKIFMTFLRTHLISLGFLIIFSPTILLANSTTDELVRQALELKLDQHSTWHKLLHYDILLGHSEVLTDTFFISPQGHVDPKQELIATLQAYSVPISSDNESLTAARCRFPARYLWLNQKLNLPEYQFRTPMCSHFERWAKFDEVRSISAIMVSGYFGNPASTFGHSLLKFNSDESSRYLDLTFNYGALVPENEPVIRYIFRGVFGGYDSGFSDGYYYSQDMVYSRTEFRDMWDYELDLSEYERHLIISHLWEVAGKKFDYYFFTKNCAFRIAEVLTLIEDDNQLTSRARLWYAPVELFNRIDDVNKKKSNGYIKTIRFIPSAQRTLYARLADLNATELQAFNQALVTEQFSFVLDEASKIKVLNSLLAFYEFKDVALMDSTDLTYKSLKRKVLIKRIALPVEAESDIEIKSLPSPQLTAPPMMFGFGASHIDQPQNANRFNLRWSPFFYDSVSLNSLQGGELVLFDATLSVDETQQAEISKVDLIRLRKMPTYNPVNTYEKEWAWSLQLSLKPNLNNQLSPSFTGGVFDGLLVNDVQYLFGFNVHIEDEKPAWFFAEPYIGMHYQADRFKAWLQLTQSYDLKHEDWQEKAGFKLGYFINPRHAIRFEANRDQQTQLALVYQFFM